MYRTTLFAGALATMLAGCATLGLDNATVDRIQASTIALCAFVPTAVTIANIISKNAAGLNKAAEVAAAICAAVLPATPRSTAPAAFVLNGSGPYIPRVANVPIEGRFIR